MNFFGTASIVKNIYRKYLKKGESAPSSKNEGSFTLVTGIENKRTFLNYFQSPKPSNRQNNSASELTIRRIQAGNLDKSTRLKLKLYKSTDEETQKTSIRELFNLRDYDAITLTLKRKKANEELYVYASNLALLEKDYLAAIRLIKDIQKPIVYQPIFASIVCNQDYSMIKNAVDWVRAYILHYNRQTEVEANSYTHHIYSFCAYSGAANKLYDLAFQWAPRARGFSFVWLELVNIIAKNKDFIEIQRFAEQAGHLQSQAYEAVLQLCPSDSFWNSEFKQKAHRDLLLT